MSKPWRSAGSSSNQEKEYAVDLQKELECRPVPPGGIRVL